MSQPYDPVINPLETCPVCRRFLHDCPGHADPLPSLILTVAGFAALVGLCYLALCALDAIWKGLGG